MARPALETRHLVLLTTLDELGSLNAAARQLHLTPSALSQQLRELEQRLGGPLFQRQWRRLVMTTAGRRLTDAARAVLDELARAESDVRELLSGASGTIRVATMCHQSYRWLSVVLQHFAEAWPQVEVTIVADAASAPYEWIAQRRLDVALVAGEIAPTSRIRLAPLFRDELVALVGSGHAWFARRHVALSAFAEQHVWADDGLFQRSSALGKALAEASAALPRKVTLVPMTGIVPIEMARANLGITVMPRWAIEPLLGGGDLHAVRIGPRGVWLDWAAATRNEAPEPSLAAFLHTLSARHPRVGRPDDRARKK
jgi:LysR family transcriptional regulator, regulator for metE and metH